MSLNLDPLILFFDVDHTLMLVNSDGHELSKSAEIDIGDDNYTYQEGRGDVVRCTRNVRAIAQPRFKEIFDQIRQINQKSPRICVGILTASKYSRDFVETILNALYADDEQELAINYYYNRKDLIKNISDQETFYKTVGQYKTAIMEKVFLNWQELIPHMSKQNFVLVDNAKSNILPVQKAGFTGLHFPSTIKDCTATSYTVGSATVFETLKSLLALYQS